MIVARAARATDDLAILWPNTAKLKLNLDQVLVLTDGEEGPILAGALFMDGGHDVVFVAEARNVAPRRSHARCAKLLHDAIWDWMRRRGKTLALFHCAQGPYPAMLQRAGARVSATNMMLLIMAVDREHWEDAPCAT